MARPERIDAVLFDFDGTLCDTERHNLVLVREVLEQLDVPISEQELHALSGGDDRVASWAEVAREVFELTCGNGGAVAPVTTAEYYAGAAGPVAPRPGRSDLDLSKVRAAGFSPRDWEDELREYLSTLKEA